MFYKDVDADDSNDLSTDVILGTNDNSTTTTADTLVDTRINTTRKIAIQVQREAKN